MNKEEKIIGNLKNQFIRPSLNAQRKIGISPSAANGNISLAYYRGLAEGRREMLSTVLRALRKINPEAAKQIKNQIKL